MEEERECWGCGCDQEGFPEVTVRKEKEMREYVGKQCSSRKENKDKCSEVGQFLLSSRTKKEVNVAK